MRGWIFILLFVVMMISPVLASAQCDPPVTGDWFVNETESCSGTTIVLDGSLLVNESGELTLQNSVLKLNSSYDGEFGIEVNGSLSVLSSRIETNAIEAYAFFSDPGAKLEIKDSYIYDCGYSTSDARKLGVYIGSDGANVTNTTFSLNRIALLVFSDNNNISNNRILSNYGGLVSNGSDNLITGNIIKGNTEGGIITIVGENVFLEHNVIEDNAGSGFPEMELKYSVINNNTFVNNTGGGFGVMGNNNNITDNNITSNGGTIAGFVLTNSQNTRVEGNTILENFIGLYLQFTKDTLVKDNLCNMSEKYDVFMLSTESTTFENTDYTTLIKKWILDVMVVDMNGSSVENANVMINDNFTTTAFSGNTNLDGEVVTILDEKIENESGNFSFNPYSINVTKPGYFGNFMEFNITDDLSLQITLNSTGEEPPPVEENFTVTIVSPTNSTYIKNDLTANGTLKLEVTSGKNMTSCNYSVNNTTNVLYGVTPKLLRAYLNVSGMEGPYELSIECVSFENITNSSSVHFTIYPTRECVSHDDCENTQICANYHCVDLDCDCGYAEDHECVYYECCEDDDCDEDEFCDTETNTCEDVPCPCPEKIIDHECQMEVGYCCSGFQCDDNEECINHGCVERTLSLDISGEFVLGQNISILVLDQNGDPVGNVKIKVSYSETDPPVLEEYYTNSEGIAEIPIKHWGRVNFNADKGGYVATSASGEVPAPFDWLFLVQIIVLIGCVAGIVIVGLKFLKGGKIGLGGGPLKLEKTVSGSRVMLKIKNKTGKRMQNITIRDYVPRRAFIRCGLNPKVEPFDRARDLLTWEILKLDPKEEVTIEYETRQATKGFFVKFHGKEYEG